MQWVARLTRNWLDLTSNPIKGYRCFCEQKNIPELIEGIMEDYYFMIYDLLLNVFTSY